MGVAAGGSLRDCSHIALYVLNLTFRIIFSSGVKLSFFFSAPVIVVVYHMMISIDNQSVMINGVVWWVLLARASTLRLRSRSSIIISYQLSNCNIIALWTQTVIFHLPHPNALSLQLSTKYYVVKDSHLIKSALRYWSFVY